MRLQLLAAVLTAASIALSGLSRASADTILRVQGTLNQTAMLTRTGADFQSQNAGTTVDVQGTSSGAGIVSLRDGSIDVAAVDVALDDPAFDDTNIGVLGFAIIAGPNTGVTNLTRVQIARIYAGKVTNWREVGGNDQKIVLFGRGIGTGVRLVFEEKVAKELAPVRSPLDPKELVADVASTPGAIGYVAASFIAAQPHLALAYDGVALTPENLRAHTYEFSTEEHLYVRKDASAAARAFVAYVKSQRATLASFGIY
jgi:phosphate transport system substrate-binding protein